MPEQSVLPMTNTELPPILYLVVPCYNEAEVLPETSRVLKEKMASLISSGSISSKSRILFSNDGSTDATWQIICSLHGDDSSCGLFTGISLAHNRGHQNALFAGLMAALERGCDIAISLDADLQDDINVIEEMIEAHHEGANIVYGVRNNRDTDSKFKRGTAQAFYKLMSSMDAEIIPNSADYRLMDKQALIALSQYEEVNLFLRGIVPLLGFKTAKVYYRRGERLAGESKYPLSKMLSLAIDGITSFSVTPLRAVTTVGVAFVFIALAALIYALASLISGNVVSGWTSLLISIWFVGGCLMLSLGVVGEYIGRIYMESKHRPRYFISEELS